MDGMPSCIDGSSGMVEQCYERRERNGEQRKDEVNSVYVRLALPGSNSDAANR